MSCPLCSSRRVEQYHRDQRRDYLVCGNCSLVFVPIEHHLSLGQEKAEYDMHQNSIDDPGYIRFLSRLAQPLSEHVARPARGLDFGCGPGPVLSHLLEEYGFEMDIYDPFFFPDSSVFTKRYDCICASEVVEHFRSPGLEFERLFNMLSDGGWLGVMTKMVRDRKAFSNWHYIRDLTHISFFSRATFHFLASQFNAEPIFVGDDVVLLKRSSGLCV